MSLLHRVLLLEGNSCRGSDWRQDLQTPSPAISSQPTVGMAFRFTIFRTAQTKVGTFPSHPVSPDCSIMLSSSALRLLPIACHHHHNLINTTYVISSRLLHFHVGPQPLLHAPPAAHRLPRATSTTPRAHRRHLRRSRSPRRSSTCLQSARAEGGRRRWDCAEPQHHQQDQNAVPSDIFEESEGGSRVRS
ncbi:hypothetical protein BDY17DRAFT_303019 [Neohortaea acidophila]|uniref:Uncharacterized protein n=1 Tax=Neohortaea acidophila TaxID=245834 RepID=A0A6A6PJY7_9PEZI|nr:uncharacterized protein BDY17DRAFT_303019 [Neohortaea acidophila]KAF2479984.1 hypothetical protein BDY17DRAFT_303019 [Neohortaea acidophila]